MTTATLSGPALRVAQLRFLEQLPRMTRVIRARFRHYPPGPRADAVAATQAAAWLAWHGLVRRGKDPLDVGVAGIAFNAARYVRNDRRFGAGSPGRGADVFDRRTRSRFGFALVDLGTIERDPRGGPHPWRDWWALDNSVTPADQAAFRLDFQAWLEGLPGRKRRTAELLAEGHGTGDVARRLGVTPGAVSQARAWLAASWRAFQADADA